MFERIMQPEIQHYVKSQNLHTVDPDTGALLVNRAAEVQGRCRCRQGIKWTKSRVHSKLKVQNSSTFQGLSRTQIAFVKHQNYWQKAIS